MLPTIEPKFIKSNEIKIFLKNALLMISILVIPPLTFATLKHLYFKTQCNKIFYRGTYFFCLWKNRETIKTWKDLQDKYFSINEKKVKKFFNY